MERLRPLLLLTFLSIILSTIPSIAPAHGEVKGPLGAALDRYVSELAGYGYSGSVLVAQHGEVVLDKGYGLADQAHNVPFTADTLFDIASISKPFTAAAVLRLEMRGKLKVEDKISRFFPEAPPDKAGITLHQLLSHTSGLPEIIGEEYDPLTRKAFLQWVFAARLVHPPGGRFLYSNVGYSLLAAVVEVATGRPFGEVLRGEVFLPAGMRHSGYLPDAADRARLAHGYTGEGDWGTSLDHPHAPDGPWWNLRGNGGVLTTTGDLYRWHLALQGNTVLSAAEREKYERPNVREGKGPFPQYAYGWSVSKSPSGHKQLSHVGGNGVFLSDYRRYPEDGAVIAITSNTAGYSSIAIADQLELRLFGQPSAEPPKTAPGSEADLRRCAGTYSLPSGERLAVAAERSRLSITPDGRDGLTLLSGRPGEDRRRRFAEREREVTEAMAAALRGDLGPTADILVDAMDGARRWRAAMATTEARLGPWKGATVLGTRSIGGLVVTHARLTFAKGTRVLDVAWTGPTADHLSVGRGLWPTFFLPEGPSRFVTYEVGTGTTVHLSCTGKGADVPTLRFETGGGVVTARRQPG
ncbi:MAG TPA: serine hydrolase domain-containing protein [Thermoanaerobaculia bacterium]